MGAWSTKVFDNEIALSWASQLAATGGGPELIIETLQRVDTGAEEPLDAEISCQSLAAAEVLASIAGKPRGDLPEQIKTWVGDREFEIEPEVLEFARQVVTRVQTNSKLKDQWEQTEDGQSWHYVLEDLQIRLTPHSPARVEA